MKAIGLLGGFLLRLALCLLHQKGTAKFPYEVERPPFPPMKPQGSRKIRPTRSIMLTTPRLYFVGKFSRPKLAWCCVMGQIILWSKVSTVIAIDQLPRGCSLSYRKNVI